MKRLFTMQHTWMLIFALISGLYLTSCSKEKSVDGDTDPVLSGQLSDADSLKYLMYRIMQVSFVDGGRDSAEDLPTYYWYDQVPSLDPLSKTYDTAEVLLKKMMTFPKDNQGKPIDKYSFLDNGEITDEIQGGVAGDLGLEVSFARDAEEKMVLVVLYADKNGPAYNAGVRRGYLITRINGVNVVYDNGPGLQKIYNAIYADEQATFTFKKQDNSTFERTLYRAVYPLNPILFDTVYTVGNKKVGYFVFYTFSNIQNQNGNTLTKTEIDRVFARFENEGVRSVIADFRYNGGGSVNTAEYMASKLAPAAARGQTMYKYKFNDKLTARSADIGLPGEVKFETTGNLNLQNIFFIGSRSTASASELVLNNLKPYVDVKLVGDTTLGKPVGFFTFTISVFRNGIEKYLADLYAINFETLNASNQGEYYHGLLPDGLASDYIGTPWGDYSGDENLIKIFNYINTGNFGRKAFTARTMQDKSLVQAMKTSLKSPKFDGMVDERIGKVLQKNMEMNMRRGR